MAKRYKYPCTECGGDAEVALSAGSEPGQDWGGKIFPEERICLSCAKKRRVILFRDPGDRIVSKSKKSYNGRGIGVG